MCHKQLQNKKQKINIKKVFCFFLDILTHKIYSIIPIPLQYPKLQYLRNTGKFAKYRSKSILNIIFASFSTVATFSEQKKKSGKKKKHPNV